MKKDDLNELMVQRIRLNKESGFSYIKETQDVIYAESRYIKDAYSNFIYLKNISKGKINEYIEYFKKKDLKPSFYIAEDVGSDKIGQLLEQYGFENSEQEVIMVLQEPIGGAQDFDIVKVTSRSQEDKFIEIFYKVFCSEGQDIYSGLSDGYIDLLRNYFKSYSSKLRIDLLAHKDNVPVGIITSLFNDQYALLDSSAVLPEFRKQGLSRSLMAEVVKYLGEKIIFLLTDKGSVNEKIYKKAGFKTIGTVKQYTLK